MIKIDHITPSQIRAALDAGFAYERGSVEQAEHAKLLTEMQKTLLDDGNFQSFLLSSALLARSSGNHSLIILALVAFGLRLAEAAAMEREINDATTLPNG